MKDLLLWHGRRRKSCFAKIDVVSVQLCEPASCAFDLTEMASPLEQPDYSITPNSCGRRTRKEEEALRFEYGCGLRSVVEKASNILLDVLK
jgi:hypothetical protein